MKIVVCPDSFKGTLTAAEAAEAIREGILDACPDAEVVTLPLGDGGEGTVSALSAALPGVETVECATVDPLRRPVTAKYAVAGGSTALIETAAASGLTLLRQEERDIFRADTYGTGLLIADAWRRGIREFVVCMGGTATCDGGLGAYTALYPVIKKDPEIAKGDFTLLCDVENPLCGPRGAAAVFGPQKGAASDMVGPLDSRLRGLASLYAAIDGIDVADMKYAGAAGGLAGMLMACFRATPERGIGKVLELLDFDSRLKGVDLVVTGEGRSDLTTLSGKAPAGVLERARRRGVAVALLCGRINARDALLEAGFCRAVEAAPPDGMATAAHLRHAAGKLVLGISDTT